MNKKKISRLIVCTIIVGIVIYVNHLTYNSNRWLQLPDIINLIKWPSMRKQLTHFDIYDIFTFPENGDMCRFEKFSLSKEIFLAGDFFDKDIEPVKKYMFYFLMPTNNEVTMGELADLFDILYQATDCKELVWGCSSDDKIAHYEVFLIKAY